MSDWFLGQSGMYLWCDADLAHCQVRGLSGDVGLKNENRHSIYLVRGGGKEKIEILTGKTKSTLWVFKNNLGM